MRNMRAAALQVVVVLGVCALLAPSYGGSSDSGGAPQGRLLAAEGTVAVPPAKAAVQTVPKPLRIRWAAQFSPDGKTVAVSSGSRTAPDSGELVLLDASTGNPLAVHQRELGIRAVAYSRDGTRLAIGDFEGYAALLDPATLKVQTTLPKRDQPVYAVAFSADGKLLITGSLDGTVTIWDVEQSAIQQTLSLAGEMITGVAVSPDGRWLAIAMREGTVQLRDWPSLQERHTLQGSAVPGTPVRVVEALAFSPDSTRLLTGSWDKTLRLWNVETGQVVRDFQGVETSLHSATFSADGTLIAAGNSRGAIAIWDVRHDYYSMKLDARSGRCFGVSFSPDGRHLAFATWGGESQIWDLESRAVIRELLPKNQYGNPVVQRPPEPKPVCHEFNLFVTTTQGTPLAGASVIPKWYYQERLSALIPEGVFSDQKTNAEGLVRITLPEPPATPNRHYERMRQAFQAGVLQMGVVVEHPDFPAATANAKTEQVRVTLQQPATIEIRAHREQDPQLLSDLEFVCDTRYAPAFSHRTESDGVVTLRNVDLLSEQSLKQLRVVHFPPAGPPLFSELISLPQKGELSLKYDLVLKPGVRVEGRLADDVPRPVTNGRVAACITRGSWTTGRSQLTLTAEVAPDGTFVFEALPAGDVLQMVAVCEGWASIPSSVAELDAYAAEVDYKNWSASQALRVQLLPQMCRLQGLAVQPVLAMARTTSCEVRVLDEHGSPLPGLTVSGSPNHQFVNGGSYMLAQVVHGLDREQMRLLTGEKRRTTPYEYPRSPFTGLTDASGTVTISGLPTGVGAMELWFKVASDSANPFAEPMATKTVTVFAGELARTTIRIVAKPK